MLHKSTAPCFFWARSPCCRAALLIWLPGGSEEMFLPRKKSQPLPFQNKTLISKQALKISLCRVLVTFQKTIPKLWALPCLLTLNKAAIHFAFRQHWTDTVQAFVRRKWLFTVFRFCVATAWCRCPSDPNQLLSARELMRNMLCSDTEER